jgi:hypothetical protein
MISRRSAILAAVAVFGLAADAQALPLKGRYFVVVWSYQGSTDPAEAHTFATFYRGDQLARGDVQPLTISWLPATGVVQPSGVEPGKNLSLGATLALASKHGFNVEALGPYEISAETYAHAQARVRLLNSGKVAYTMINGPDGAINCIEAAGSIDSPISTGASYGPSASAAVAQHLALHADQVDRDAAARLHLESYLKGP